MACRLRVVLRNAFGLWVYEFQYVLSFIYRVRDTDQTSVGVFQGYLSTHQLKDYSEGTIGWIFGVYVFLAFFGGLQIGPVFDAKGPFWLILAGSIIFTLSIFLMSICTRKSLIT